MGPEISHNIALYGMERRNKLVRKNELEMAFLLEILLHKNKAQKSQREAEKDELRFCFKRINELADFNFLMILAALSVFWTDD